MLARFTLCALLAATPVIAPEPARAVRVVPDEPESVVLPDRPVLQAAVADLDANGTRDLVRIVWGRAGRVEAEAWTLGPDGWAAAGEPIEIMPASRQGIWINPVYAGAPVRLLVRQVDGRDRVTVARQPAFSEIDVGPPCCLLIEDLAIADGALRTETVATPSDAVGAVFMVDLDGDATDELVTTLSLPPIGDISYPTEARVYRWDGTGFDEPTFTELRVGSGDTPFLIGDTDGRPGEELGMVSTLGPPGFFRYALGGGDKLVVEALGGPADDAIDVPLGDGRGIAIVDGEEISLRSWAAGESPSDPIATASVSGGELLGVVRLAGEPRLVVGTPANMQAFALPSLVLPIGPIPPSPAAAAFASLPVRPYAGPLPGGGPDGQPAILYGGRLIPSDDPDDLPFPLMGTTFAAILAGAAPVGLVGDRDWLAILHAPYGPAPLDPSGGRFEAPVARSGAWMSIAPLAAFLAPEEDDAQLEPMVTGAIPLDARGRIAVAATGFTAEIVAPRGSRVIALEVDPSVTQASAVVPESGRLELPVRPPAVPIPDPRYRTSIIVSTPGGHAYVATWDVQVLTSPPELDARTETSFGSSAVTVSGRTVPYATVTVDGSPVDVSPGGRFEAAVSLPPWPTDVVVEARDFAGNEARTTITGVGIFDYRTLPWIPIVGMLVAAAGVVLYLHVPRVVQKPRRADDDAVFEELEPD